MFITLRVLLANFSWLEELSNANIGIVINKNQKNLDICFDLIIFNIYIWSINWLIFYHLSELIITYAL